MNHNGRRILLLAAGLPAIFACGCNFFFNPCWNITCDEGQECVNGACVEPECNSNDDCAAGQTCVNGACVSEDECNSNDDCGSGQVCDNGECVAEPECQTDADCDGGQVCDEDTNTCVECEGNADCDDDDACTADSCANLACLNVPIVCATVANCPEGCDASCTLGICSN